MGLLYLEYPRLPVQIELPEPLAGAFASNFAHVTVPRPAPTDAIRYRVVQDTSGIRLLRDSDLVGVFAAPLDALFALEEDLENRLIDRLGRWVGFHAGAAASGDTAIVVVGRPDTGKTTTTLQLVELGLDLLCEEVTPVDPDSLDVQPFANPLTFDAGYARAFSTAFGVRRGDLSFPSATMARYMPHRVRRTPARVGVMLFPHYDPSGEPAVLEVTPGQALTEVLQHCFRPGRGDEALYDAAIRILTGSRLLRIRTCSIESARLLLDSVLDTVR